MDSLHQLAQTSTRTLPSSVSQAIVSNQRHLALTVIAHPDLERIGERFVRPDVPSVRSFGLSRCEPEFTQLGKAALRRPLSDLHLSRTPILLKADEDGALTLDIPPEHRSVYLDGKKLPEGEYRLSDEHLERGAVLLLSHRIVLLLHFLGLERSQTKDFGIIGENAAIVEIRNQLPTLARLRYPLMILGETGTGKELIAQALRQLQGPSKPFESLNLAELPQDLAAARLFGSEEGAFTGAKKIEGAFSKANGGVLFLDEIGDLPTKVQPMLLRVLENQEVLPLGGKRSFKVNVWLIAATDMEVSRELETQNFRSQLFYRLSGSPVRLPPLRERRDDLGRLLVYFLRRELERLPDAPRLMNNWGQTAHFYSHIISTGKFGSRFEYGKRGSTPLSLRTFPSIPDSIIESAVRPQLFTTTQKRGRTSLACLR